MADKEIVDGADATIITELDEAAEARIIDVLSKVFVTNKYPGLRAAILEGAERYKQQREIEEKQRQYEMYEKQRFIEQSKYQNIANQLEKRIVKDPYGRGYILDQIDKQKAAMASNPNPFTSIFGKLIP